MATLGANYRKLISASAISNLGDGVAQIAYPWLASAVTRDPLLIAGVAVAQRIPWLLFSLPAGVITDRLDRRRIMIWMNVARAIVTLAVAFAVMGASGSLPSVDEIADATTAIDTNYGLYLLIVVATLLLGCAEVLFDNSSQTFLPHVVAQENLEAANGRIWSVEAVANQFIGPPLGAFLIAASFAIPFVIDSISFALSGALIALITVKLPATSESSQRAGWRSEIKEGFTWLWQRRVLRRFAIVLGCLNGLMMMTGAVLILFAQDVLRTSSTEFAFLMMAGAIGGIVGGWAAGSVTKRFGPGMLIQATLFGTAVGTVIQGLTSQWWVMALTLMLSACLGMIWNVITVSLRQRVIPDELLGRVNSVYRFFGWGMIPIGALLGGVSVRLFELSLDREMALRSTWLVSAGLLFLLALYGSRTLTTAEIRALEATAEEAT